MKKHKTFRQFLMDNEREFRYQIRFLNECTEPMLENLEACLAKYELEDFSLPKHLPWHTNPKGFGEEHGEVYVVDVMTKFPIPQQTREMVARKCGIAESRVCIISENDPALEVDTMISKFGSGEVAKLLDSEYSEQEPVDHADYYGEEYMNKIMQEMQDSVRERDIHVSKYMEPHKEEKDKKK